MNAQSNSSGSPGSNGPGFNGTLEPHQAKGVEWLLDHRHALLADDVGLGKTVVALALINRLDERGDLPRIKRSPVRVLWLTDSTLVEQTRSEVERFLPAFTVLTGADLEFGTTDKARRAFKQKFDDGPDITVVNYELAAGKNRRGWLETIHPSLVVLDEITNVSNGKGVRHGVMEELTGRTPRVLSMTATPVENDPTELYAILRVTQTPGLWPKTVFKSEYVTWRPTHVNKWGQLQYAPDGWVETKLPEVREYLLGVMLQRNENDVGLVLPEQVGDTLRWVQLTPEQQRAYDDAAKRTSALSVHQAREAAGKASGSNSALVDALSSELEQRAGEQVIVCCETLAVLDLVSDRLESEGVSSVRIEGKVKDQDRSAAVDAHRNGTHRVLLGSRVLEHGLNLQHCRILISLDSSWNPAREHQREGRIRRIGSDHATFEHLTLLPDTPLVRRKLKALERKRATAQLIRP